ncbi:unnamed protein product [Adineta steineri]|uniref:Zinc-binding loop region of homing endonuclease domain-containing protein n=1 Tax=Adineta steineri TaxID=433720 RepID=A0A819RQU9_9BILA|nr:unnamed protein product [Adineta steineri]CAF4051126.1 unnamed protein product [Adineta steineri]
MDQLPALGPTCAKTASHLCDTKHCLRASHLTLESMGMNLSRKSCPGVILTLKCTGPSTPKQIVQHKPCVYGINHPEAQGDFFKFSCRKILLNFSFVFCCS